MQCNREALGIMIFYFDLTCSNLFAVLFLTDLEIASTPYGRLKCFYSLRTMLHVTYRLTDKCSSFVRKAICHMMKFASQSDSKIIRSE